MWWILQIGAIVVISAIHMFNRWCGLHPQSLPFISQWLINIGVKEWRHQCSLNLML
jgi:hypothetical protein